jgi:hypothetical protein
MHVRMYVWHGDMYACMYVWHEDMSVLSRLALPAVMSRGTKEKISSLVQKLKNRFYISFSI